MLRDNPEYRRVKVDGYGPLGSASYWLGRDHLLVVTTSSYVENYYRFQYADIQALLIRRNPLRLIYGLVLSLLTAGTLLGALAVKVGEPAGSLSQEALIGMAVLFCLAVVFAALQTINLLRGPTCACHLRTAVQILPLPYLTRWRKAAQLRAELTPLALAAQARPAAPVAGASISESATASGAVAPTADAPTAGTPTAGAPAADDSDLPPRILS